MAFMDTSIHPLFTIMFADGHIWDVVLRQQSGTGLGCRTYDWLNNPLAANHNHIFDVC